MRGRLKLREQPPALPHLIAYARAEAERPRLERLCEALALDDSRLVSASYADLVERTRRARIARARR